MSDMTGTPSAYNELGSELRTDIDRLASRVDALVDAVATNRAAIKLLSDVAGATLDALKEIGRTLEGVDDD